MSKSSNNSNMGTFQRIHHSDINRTQAKKQQMLKIDSIYPRKYKAVAKASKETLETFPTS